MNTQLINIRNHFFNYQELVCLMRLVRLILILTITCLSLSINVNAAPYNSPSYYIKATIKDVWMDNDDCKMTILITDFFGNYTFLDEYRPERYGIEIGNTIEVTIFFHDENYSGPHRLVPGSNGYKTGDKINGRIYLLGDEDGEQYYFHSSPLSDENYAREKDIYSKEESSPFLLISVIFIILLIIVLIIFFIKKKK